MKRFWAVAIVSGTAALMAQSPPATMVEWRYVGAEPSSSKYSSLADVTPSNVDQLEVAWEWRPDERLNEEFETRPGPFQAMPLMIDNIVYLTTMYNRVVALDAETGRELWVFDPMAYRTGSLGAASSGYKHRGVAVWGVGENRRIFINARDTLFGLDAATGELIGSFGDGGRVLLSVDFPIPVTH